MPADSLQHMAVRALANRGRDIHDFGVCPVHLIQPVLPRIANPDQLLALEQRSPQIIGHTRDVWISMLKRDIPFWKERLPHDYQTTIFAPERAEKWHKVYFKLRKEVDAEKERDRARLVQGLQQVEAVRGPETAIRSSEPRYLASDHKRQRKSYGDARYAMNRDMYSKSKGEGFFDKVKRNAVSKAISRRSGAPRALKPAIEREIKRAPLGMVEDIKESRDAVVRNVGLPSGSVARSIQNTAKQDAANQRAADAAGVTRLTVNFLEDDDDDDDVMNMSDHLSDDELFGVSKLSNKTAPVAYPAQRKAPSAPIRATSPIKRFSPPMRTASPMKSQPVAATATGKGPGSVQKPTILKRTKPARSIFAKK